MDPNLSSVAAPAEAFTHVRIIIGIVLGLSVSRLLAGLARFVQLPREQIIFPVHLAWMCFLLVSIVHFWWFEFGLRTIQIWTIEKYFLVILYAAFYFLLCTLLFPDNLNKYTDYRYYFMSRRAWFFCLFAALHVVDVFDTMIKGTAHLEFYGVEYPLQIGGFILFSLIAALWSSRNYHAVFAASALIYQIVFILRHCSTLN